MAVINPWTWGLGRRKSSVARVRIKPGAGAFVVNGKPLDTYFPTLACQMSARACLAPTESEDTYDVFCNVRGGGITGQADAVSLGLARAIKTINPATYEALKEHGLLTRDSRMKERKKYGRRGARRGFQFSKR
jgi:small subunit ribosomal protein S9